MSKRTGLEKNVHLIDNEINDEENTYRSIEQRINEGVRKLAEKYPLKNLSDLKGLLEEFDSYELAVKSIEETEDHSEEPKKDPQ